MIVDFTIAIGHMTRSSYELMWIFNFVQLTPRLYIGDVHEDIQKLRVIDKCKASVAAVYERRKDWKKKLEKVEYFIAIGLLLLLWCIVENKKPNRVSYDFKN